MGAISFILLSDFFLHSGIFGLLLAALLTVE